MKTFSDKFPRVNTLFSLAAMIICGLFLRIWANTDGALILERANSNENIYSSATGEFISYLRGDVVFSYDDVRITSDEATWQKSVGIVDFRNNITVEQKGQVMTCDRLRFVRDDNMLTASGNVLYQDSAKITSIRGNTAEYMTDKKECFLRGNPLLTRLDTASVDTLFISGRTMKYNDSLKIATVTSSVSIRRGALNATSQKGDYFLKTNVAILRVKPVIYYEKHKVTGDSVDLFFGDESLKGACVTGSAHGRSTEVADSSNDTTITNIYSDSLYIAMYESGKMNYMKAFGSARGDFSETTAATKVKTVTDITSDSLQMFMFETGKISALKAFGNAVGNYSEASERTGNTTTMNISSDSMHTSMFENGKVSGMKAFGSAHGRSAEWSPSSASKDSTITHIWSDSLRVAMSDAGKINSMRALGNVRSMNFILGDSARVNEVTGRIMTLTFGNGGKIEKAVVRGDAKSIYYIEEADGGGCNRAGGDKITVTFNMGKAKRLQVHGKAKGIYFP